MIWCYAKEKMDITMNAYHHGVYERIRSQEAKPRLGQVERSQTKGMPQLPFPPLLSKQPLCHYLARCHRGTRSTNTVIKRSRAASSPSQPGSSSNFQTVGADRAFLTYWSEMWNENTLLFQQNVNPCFTRQNCTQYPINSPVSLHLRRFCSFFFFSLSLWLKCSSRIFGTRLNSSIRFKGFLRELANQAATNQIDLHTEFSFAFAARRE